MPFVQAKGDALLRHKDSAAPIEVRLFFMIPFISRSQLVTACSQFHQPSIEAGNDRGGGAIPLRAAHTIFNRQTCLFTSIHTGCFVRAGKYLNLDSTKLKTSQWPSVCSGSGSSTGLESYVILEEQGQPCP